jgi:hypothetical protein
MEDLIKFNQSIELTPDARKLMFGMIRSMQSLVPSDPVLVPEDSSEYDSRFMHLYASEVLKLSRENENIFDGIVEPGILDKYISNTDHFRQLGDQLEKLLKAIRKYQHLSGYLSHRLARMMKDHLEMIQPDICKSLDHDLSEINTEMASRRPVKHANSKLKIV